MPSYIVTLKDDASDEELAASRAKEKATAAGAKITQEYTLIKGFAVEYPEGTVTTLAEDPNVQSVELDQVVTTQ
ncbi:peptidase inhibitor i9 [Trichoderma cornu-damae]|uniref:Peptidase inhibitor i9 n=1 Tax=Trichoderma cornu-damae TaxID=654480 RepID=A0A9P8QSL3_9HYPO|nr:peptidase inhibitor i9 [Trichoderma cornu-damae]